ncbi:MAG: oligosaccharide flippase family protein [Aristaeellaceae bacterium]
MSTRKNALYNIAYRVFSVLLPLVTAPYLSRTVGQEGVGLYDYAWSISYMFCLVGMLGLENYGTRAIARARESREELNRVFSEIWRMQLLVAGVTLLAYLGYVAFIAGEEQLIALHLTMMSVSCLVNVDWCLMGLDQFKPIALRNTAVKLLAAGAVFLFVHGPEDLWIYAFAWSLATLLGCVSCWASLRGRVQPVKVPFRACLKHLAPCALLSISVVAVSVYRQMDKVMVGALAGMAENGLYANAEKIIYCLSGFISAIGTVMLPKVSNLLRRGELARVKQHIALSMELMLCMVSALAFGVAAVAEGFAPLFFGEAFTASGPLMMPLAFTLMAIGFANVIRTQWVLPNGRDKVFIISVSVGAVINLVANSLLIPRIGAMGAVVGTLLAEFSVPVTQWLFVRHDLAYGQYLGYVAVYAVMGSVMLLCVRGVGAVLPFGGWMRLMVQTAAGVLVYGMLCLLWWKARKKTAILRLLRRS